MSTSYKTVAREHCITKGSIEGNEYRNGCRISFLLPRSTLLPILDSCVLWPRMLYRRMPSILLCDSLDVGPSITDGNAKAKGMVHNITRSGVDQVLRA